MKSFTINSFQTHVYDTKGQSRFHAIYHVHYYRNLFVIAHCWRWSAKVH